MLIFKFVYLLDNRLKLSVYVLLRLFNSNGMANKVAGRRRIPAGFRNADILNCS